MSKIRSVLRTYLLPGLAKALGLVGIVLAFVGVFGPIARVLEYGWSKGLFSGTSVVFLLLFAAGILIVKWVYPFVPPSSKTGTRS
jgi:hypothetical protein